MSQLEEIYVRVAKLATEAAGIRDELLALLKKLRRSEWPPEEAEG